jgi:hypothetical protein
MLTPKADDTFEVIDTYSKQNAEPIADATQGDVSVQNVTRRSDGVFVTVQRTLLSNDTKTDVWLSPSTPLYLLYAYHRSNTDRSKQHSSAGATANRVQLFCRASHRRANWATCQRAIVTHILR